MKPTEMITALAELDDLESRIERAREMWLEHGDWPGITADATVDLMANVMAALAQLEVALHQA